VCIYKQATPTGFQPTQPYAVEALESLAVKAVGEGQLCLSYFARPATLDLPR